MPNRGGFSWKRLTGISAAKSRISRRTGIPLTRSGRQRKIGRLVTGGGCLLPLLWALLLITVIACGSAGTTSSPTRTPAPARTQQPTATLPPINTEAPTRTPMPPAVSAPVANTSANLRAGPGTNYARIGGVSPGQQLTIVARSPAGDWYQLASGAWIAAQLVNAAPEVPVAATIPTAAPAGVTLSQSSVPAAPAARGLPSAAASTCPCDQGDILNCSDFIAWDAQSCYLRCKDLTGFDVHRLDRDNDSNACEWGK